MKNHLSGNAYTKFFANCYYFKKKLAKEDELKLLIA